MEESQIRRKSSKAGYCPDHIISETGEVKKQCRDCLAFFPLSEFGKNYMYKDGMGVQCGPCRKFRWRKKKDRNLNSIHQSERRSALKIKFGMTPEQYDEMFLAQNGKCAICERHHDDIDQPGYRFKLCIDHDHKTGKVRGLLCKMCNKALGLLKDSVNSARNAANYLTRSNI